MFKQFKAKELFSKLLSMPMTALSMGYGNNLIIGNIESRDTKLARRVELYSDPFTRNIVKMTIERACGGDILTSTPYEVKIKDIENKALLEKIRDSIDELNLMLRDSIGEISLDAQILGDGYAKIELEQGKGVVRIINSIRYSPLLIAPIKNFLDDNIVAFRVNPILSSRFFGNKKEKDKIDMNGTSYHLPISFAHMNGQRRTLAKLTTEQFSEISTHEATKDNFLIEDGVYGGVCDEVYEYYLDYKYAIEALSNTRIASSVLERFITQDLDELNEDKKEAMVKTLQESIYATTREIKKKVSLKDTLMSVITHIIPSTNGSTGGVTIQDSQASAQGLNNIDDIMFMIKKYCVALGFPFNMTEFGEDPTNGMNRDTPIQQSILLETHAKAIREAIGGYVSDLIIKHIAFKHGVQLEDKHIEVLFSSSINHSKALKSAQTVEVLNEVQQFLGVIDTLKMQGLEDSEENNKMVRELLSKLTTQDEEFVEAWVKEVFKVPPADDELEGDSGEN